MFSLSDIFKNIFKLSQPTKKKTLLYGHDLDKWHYLGYTNLTIADKKYWCTVHFFVDKENDKLRDYVIYEKDDYYLKRHTWFSVCGDLWKANQMPLYQAVGNWPSPYLKEYMLNTYGFVWCDDTLWWTTNENVKYEKAVKEQKKESHEKDGKVVTVDFRGNK